jgi:hypothetical protein
MNDKIILSVLVAVFIVIGISLFGIHALGGNYADASIYGTGDGNKHSSSMHGVSDAQMMNGTNASGCNTDMHNSYHHGAGSCLHQNNTQPTGYVRHGMMYGRSMM